MDKEKERELIQAAKDALKITKDFTKHQEKSLLWIHETYLNYERQFPNTPKRIEEFIKQAEEASKRYLKEAKGFPFRLDGRKAVEGDLEWLNEWAKKFPASVIGIDDPWNRFHHYSTRKGRGNRENKRLYFYISEMSGWYNEFYGAPAFGTNSVFPRFVGQCLELINKEYENSTPFKTIKSVLTNLREAFPRGFPRAKCANYRACLDHATKTWPSKELVCWPCKDHRLDPKYF